MTRLTTVADADAAARRAATEIAEVIAGARAHRGRAHVALAGGSTPRRAYELLAGMVDEWEGVELWYGDERCVEPDDPDSNHQMVAESLLEAIAARSLAPPREHRIAGELGASEAARRYSSQLREQLPAGERSMPELDLALLGLGEDGHTASLFPGHPQVVAEDDVCLAVFDAPKPPPERVTLSMPVLRAAARTVLLVSGAGKADALAAVLNGPDRHVPASLLRFGRLHIICDDAAAPPPVRG